DRTVQPTELHLANLHKPWSELQNKAQGKTTTVRVFGDGSFRPASSVTVRVATNMPGVEYVTLPGVASLLAPGLPPGNDQEYAVTVPSGSVPDPEKNTDCRAQMFTSLEGLLSVPVGGTSAGETMMVRVFGFGSLRPALSVTVRVALFPYTALFRSLPGVASLLAPGLPPGNDQEYAVTVPSGSVPDPEKN